MPPLGEIMVANYHEENHIPPPYQVGFNENRVNTQYQEEDNENHITTPHQAVTTSRLPTQAALLRETLKKALVAIENSEAPDMLLNILREREDRAFASSVPRERRGDTRGVDRAVKTRSACVYTIGTMCDMLDIFNERIFQAVALFDMYCLRARSTVAVETLPGICTSICYLLYKFGTACMRPHPATMQAVQDLEHVLLTKLQASDLCSADAAGVSVGEVEILEVINWQLDLPTVETWLQAFSARFNCATFGKFEESNDWIMEQGVNLARYMLMSDVATELSPREFALGHFCRGLVGAGLLPAEMLLEGIPRDSEGLAEAVQGLPTASDMGCDLPEPHRRWVFESMLMATGANIGELQLNILRFFAITDGVMQPHDS